MCDRHAGAVRRCFTSSPAGLANGTSYFRQIVATNATGDTTVSSRSFAAAAAASDANPTSLSGWGSLNGVCWLPQATTLSSASSGPHDTNQVREHGMPLDQIVLGPSQ